MQYSIDTGSVTVNSAEFSVNFTNQFKNVPVVAAVGDSNTEIFLSDVTTGGFKINVSSFSSSFVVKYHAIDRS